MGYTRIVSRDNLKFHNKRESFVVCFHSCLLFSDHEFLCRSGRINEWLKEKRVWKEWERERNLHNLVVVPEDGIAMEILGGVEPKHVPHLTATSSILVHVCLNQIGLPGPIPQELKIQLISRWPCPIFRAHLQHSHVLWILIRMKNTSFSTLGASDIS